MPTQTQNAPRELIFTDQGKLEWASFDPGSPGEGEVSVTHEFAAAKHGTELAMYKGYAGQRGDYDDDWQVFTTPPADRRTEDHPVNANTPPPGNMAVGRVSELGPGVTSLCRGRRVAVYGPFREAQTLPAEWCWPMPEEMPWQSAVCLDPTEFAVGAVRDGHVRIGDAVAVFGLGAIGLMVVQVARLAGAWPVIAVDPIEHRRQTAKRLGAHEVVDPTVDEAGIEIKRLTDRRGVDVAIDYSGAVAAMNAAFRAVAYGGTIVSGSFPPTYGPGLDFGGEAHFNTPKLVFSRSCSQPDHDHPRWDRNRIFETCWRLLSEGRLTGEPVVNPVLAPDQLPEVYVDCLTDPAKAIKLGVSYNR